jgi:multiple sugar transport system ATP-binding protein
MSFLRLEALEKTYPDGTRAVRGIELSMEAGEFLVLLGPSGCGKTTTLRMIAGLELPTAGRVVLDGEDVTQHAPARRDVGFVFQFYALYPHMTVEQNVSFPLEAAGLDAAERRARMASVVDRLGLQPLLRRKPRQLSGGDQQRVALARAMVRRPKVWLMDEPLGTLDHDVRLSLREFLRTQQRELGVSTVYVTHDQEEAMGLADRIVVMDGGRILQVGTPAEVYAHPADLTVARFVGSPGMNLIEGEVRGGAFHPADADCAIELPAPAPEGRATLGVRPEGVLADGGGPLSGQLTVDEFVGHCRFLHYDLGFARLVQRSAPGARRVPGDEARLRFAPGAIRMFDARGEAVT